MNFRLLNRVYADLKEYIEKNSRYSTRVLKKSLKQTDNFPLIIITQDDNSNELITTDFKESIDKIYFSINIYAQDISYNNITVSNVNVAEELACLVNQIMQKQYKMKRTSCKPTPNLDDTIYRITMKYTKKIIENKSILI